MAAPREMAARLCREYLPETTDLNKLLHWEQIGFDHIAKDYGQGMGTTCGFLPQWLLWRLGCRDAELVCRSAPEQGLSYKIGEQIGRLVSGYGVRNVPSWVAMDTPEKTRAMANGTGGPKQGDFVIIRGQHWNDSEGKRTRDSSHIFVLVDVLSANGKKVTWRVAQTGLSTHAGKQAGQITTMSGELTESDVPEGAVGKVHKGPNLVFTSNILNEEPNYRRRVIGYTDLDRVSFGSPPDASFTAMFDARSTLPATNQPGKIQEWQGWWEMGSPGGFIPLAPTYLLLDRGHEAFRLEKGMGHHQCVGRGLWTRDGATLKVVWHDATPDQSWVVTRSFVPRMETKGAPSGGRSGPLRHLGKPPQDLPLNWRMV